MLSIEVFVHVGSSPLKGTCTNGFDVDGWRSNRVLADFVSIVNVIVVVARNVEDEARGILVGVLKP